MEKSTFRIKNKIAAVIVVDIFFSFSSVLLAWAAEGLGAGAYFAIIGFCLHCALCYFLYKRKNWARISLAALFIVAMIIQFGFIIYLIGNYPDEIRRNVVQLVTYFWMTATLLSKDTKNYFDMDSCSCQQNGEGN